MSIYHRLDDVVMSAIDRENAKAHMQSAELLIDFVFAVVEKTRLLGAATARRLAALATSVQGSRRQAAQS